MILIDVGNTNIVFAASANNLLKKIKRIKTNDDNKKLKNLINKIIIDFVSTNKLDNHNVAIISSVVPNLNLLIKNILKKHSIKGYVITDIQNDGMLKGLNLDFVNNFIKKINLIKKFNKQIVIAGGLTDYSDLINLKKLNTKNIEGIISGKSFYEGKIDLVEAQKILN